MQSKVPLYPYNAKTAQERGEIEKWRESFRENCACAGAIEISIREHFDGMHLKDGAVEWAVKQYGYKRAADRRLLESVCFDGNRVFAAFCS